MSTTVIYKILVAILPNEDIYLVRVLENIDSEQDLRELLDEDYLLGSLYDKKYLLLDKDVNVCKEEIYTCYIEFTFSESFNGESTEYDASFELNNFKKVGLIL